MQHINVLSKTSCDPPVNVVGLLQIRFYMRRLYSAWGLLKVAAILYSSKSVHSYVIHNIHDPSHYDFIQSLRFHPVTTISSIRSTPAEVHSCCMTKGMHLTSLHSKMNLWFSKAGVWGGGGRNNMLTCSFILLAKYVCSQGKGRGEWNIHNRVYKRLNILIEMLKDSNKFVKAQELCSISLPPGSDKM